MGGVNSNHILVLIFLISAIFADIKYRRISNKHILTIFILGVCFQLYNMGTSAIFNCLASLLAAFLIALPFYLLKIFGGGDFKLLLGVSVLLDWKTLITMTILSFVWGALLGLIQVILKGQFGLVVSNIFSLFKKQIPQASSLHMIPFTVAIFFGFLSSLSVSYFGLRLL